jgi:hypothetical protein
MTIRRTSTLHDLIRGGDTWRHQLRMLFASLGFSLRIGQLYAVPGPDGAEVSAKLTHATVAGDKAHCAVYDANTNKSWMVSFDLSPEEVADYEKYLETFFGAYQKQTGRVETVIEMFDFFFDTYRHTPKERLLELMAGSPDHEALAVFRRRKWQRFYVSAS